MKIESIKEKIKSSELKLSKLNETLGRHNKQLEKKKSILLGNEIDLNNYDKYNHDSKDHEFFWELCDYEHKLDDIKNTNMKIEEVKSRINNLKDQLDKQIAKDDEINQLIPEALILFLEDWKKKCYEFFVSLSEKYLELVLKDVNNFEINKIELEQLTMRKYNSTTHEFEDVQRYTDEEITEILIRQLSEHEIFKIKQLIKDRYIKLFIRRHYDADIVIVVSITNDNIINYAKLNKILDEDVKAKKEMFINRIQQVIGDVKDLSGLRIAGNGEINGIAIGVKCNANVQTIKAGGYNIQCEHFRVLVTVLEKE